MIGTILLKAWAHVINSIAKSLPPDSVSNRIRTFIYRAIGLKAHYSTSVSALEYLNAGRLEIGRRCFENQGVFFDLTSPIEIGDEVVVGLQTSFITAHHAIGGERRHAETYSVVRSSWRTVCGSALDQRSSAA